MTPRRQWGVAALAAALLLAALAAAAVGSVSIPPARVLNLLLHPVAAAAGDEVAVLQHTILWDIRLPRIVLAILVGAGLSTAGTAFQGLLRNPLADPYLLGVSGGSAVGAAAAVLLNPLGGMPLSVTVPVLSFAGALLAVALVYYLAYGRGRLGTTALVLAGVAVGSVFYAIMAYVQTTGSDRVQKAVIYWLAGGLGAATWDQVRMAAPYVLVGLAVLLVFARDLDVILLGEEAAGQLGVPVEAAKRWVLGAASLITAAAVSVSGLIPFVGLIVPHMLRLVLGPHHRTLLPGAALGGALFLLVADTAGRTLWSPLEVRVSVISGLAGGPFFLWLLRRHLSGE